MVKKIILKNPDDLPVELEMIEYSPLTEK